MLILNSGDEVAILPSKKSLPQDVFEIAVVAYAGPALIELADGRVYCVNDGQNIGRAECGWIVRASEAHRAAYRAKLR
jgi:hypothetical protein